MTLIVRDEGKNVVATARPRSVRARATRFVFPRTHRPRRRRQRLPDPGPRADRAGPRRPREEGHDGQRPDRRRRDLDGLLPPGRGAADLDGAGDRAAHRAHARDARRDVARRHRRAAAGGERRPRRLGDAGPAARAPEDRPDRRARRRSQHARVGPARPGDPDPRRALPPLLRAGPRRAPQAARRLRRLPVGGAQRDRQRRRARRHQLQPRRPRLLEPGRGRRSSTARWRRSRPPTTRARASTCATIRPPTTRRSSRPTGPSTRPAARRSTR